MSFEELGTFEYAVTRDEEGDGLPRIWWYNGDRRTKTPGDFYTRADAWDGDLPSPWDEAERFDGERGWAAPVLRILPITYRSQPFSTVESGGRKQRVYEEKWAPGMSVHTELLCFIEGVEGPVVWSMKGMTGAATTGKGGIFATARQLLITPAEKALKKKVPMHAFWLPVGTRLNAQGKTDYEELKQHGSIITPPALRLPAGLEGRDLLNALYAGRAIIEAAGAVRDEFEAWRKERRVNEPQPEVKPARNAPRPIEDDPYYADPFGDDVA